MSSDAMTSEENNWERDIIREMSKVFEQMGIPMDMGMLENMMNQLEEHFERMGIDAKSISKTDITLNGKGDPEEIRKNIEAMMSGPGGFADMLSKMGFEVSVKSSKNTPNEQVDVVTEPQEDNRLIEIPDTDFIHNDGFANVMIDVTSIPEADDGSVDLALADGGRIIELLRHNLLNPLRGFSIPFAASRIEEWNLNNGILDVTLRME
ncbi:MAG: hypothetical protein CMB75_03890 [Euryarchaeota archaeon]|nr:hypothetical protein [Euryarchaeota archaeon]